MCIPIELDVPVVTLDQQEIGIAREILCPCPGDIPASAPTLSSSFDGDHRPSDLWLRVTRSARRDLYVPFAEIAEARPDGVRLRIREADIARRDWERPPVGVPVPA